MAEPIDFTSADLDTQFHRRAEAVLTALRYLKSGGTATDVRESCIDLGHDKISVSSCRRDLKFFGRLGLVRCERLPDQTKWWSAVDNPSGASR